MSRRDRNSTPEQVAKKNAQLIDFVRASANGNPSRYKRSDVCRLASLAEKQAAQLKRTTEANKMLTVQYADALVVLEAITSRVRALATDGDELSAILDSFDVDDLLGL